MGLDKTAEVTSQGRISSICISQQMPNLFLKVIDWDSTDCPSRQSFSLIILTVKKFFVSVLSQLLLQSTPITSCPSQSK